MVRFSLILFFVALILGLIVGPISCGGEAVPPSSSTTVAAETSDATAVAVIDEMADYGKALRAWFTDYVALAEIQGASALEFDDPFQPTEGEMARAREFIEMMRSSVAELKTIPVPAKVAQAHGQLRSALSGELGALERYVSALDWGSARDAEPAFRQAEESYVLFTQAVKGLDPYLDLSGIMEN